MKLKTTTPASISSKMMQKIFIFATIVVLVIASLIYINNRPVSADEYDDRISALQADMARFQAEADRLNAEATTLANALAQITNEKNAIQAQVNLSQTQYDKLVQQIAATEKKIEENQDALGTTITDLYVDDKITPIEMLASSQNIGEYIDKQEYRESVRDQLTSTIKTVKDLKKQLSDQKVEVEKVLQQQKTARDALAAKEAEQANLLARTQNDEANYQGMIKDSQAQINEARATQAAIRARLNSSGGYTLIDTGSMGGGYPWGDSNCPMVGYLSSGGSNGSGGDGYGYGCRQCASYAAWRIAKETGIYYRWGNAKDFTNNAINAGYQDLGMNPQPGSIAVMDPAKAGQGFGHVGWVEEVYGDTIVVSQYNLDYGQGYGMYSKMEMSRFAFDHFVKIK